MTEDVNVADVEKLYSLLGISKNEEFNEDFFNSEEKDEHLAWKPLTF